MKNLTSVLNPRKTEEQLIPSSKNINNCLFNIKNIQKAKESIKFAEFMKEEDFLPSINLTNFIRQEESKIILEISDYHAELYTVINRIPVLIRYGISYSSSTLFDTFDSKVEAYIQMKQKLEEIKHDLKLVDDKLRRFKLQNKCLSKTFFSSNSAFSFRVPSPENTYPSYLIGFKYEKKLHNIALIFIKSKFYMYYTNISQESSLFFDKEIFTTYQNVMSIINGLENKKIPESITKIPLSVTNSTENANSTYLSRNNGSIASTETEEEEEEDCDDF